MPGSGGTTLISCLWLFLSSLMFTEILYSIQCIVLYSHSPDGPNVQPDKVGGREGVKGCRDPHQVGLLIPDPVEESIFPQ